jgi:hypothetical protein
MNRTLFYAVKCHGFSAESKGAAVVKSFVNFLDRSIGAHKHRVFARQAQQYAEHHEPADRADNFQFCLGYGRDIGQNIKFVAKYHKSVAYRGSFEAKYNQR